MYKTIAQINASTFDFQHYMTDWTGISENDTVPEVGHTIENLWVDESNNIRPTFGEPNTKYAVAIGTLVWPIYVRTGWDLDATLGEITKETKHEWTIERGMYDYDKYVCVIFSEQAEDEDSTDGRMTKGFFVLKDALYISTKREGERAKNGKRIAKRLEVQSSSNKSKKYEVLYYEDGTASCNCHSWIYSKTIPKSCKHSRKVILDICNRIDNGTPTP